jgi:branched-chain amino acid transport system permease protein
MLLVIVSGLAVGALYAATALVYNVMFSTSKVLSVTTGHICMLGGVFGAWLVSDLGVPSVIALAGAALVGGAFGFLTEIVAVRRVLSRQQAVGLWWGTEPRPFPRLIPQDFSAGVLDQKYWLPIVTVIVMVLGLEFFYRRTMYGKVFVAMSEDVFAAQARGIATSRVRSLSYIIAGALGAVAGFAAGQLTFAFFAVGHGLTLYGFIALAAGGLGSNLGALVGGLALGLFSTFATYFFGGEYQQTIAVGLLIIILLLKPEGLFGQRQVRAV